MIRALRNLLLIGAAALAAAPNGVTAQEGESSSTEGALFLLLPVGAKAVSLGRSMTAMASS